ncbi:MAG: biotin--[acetyl-CoA-carboxylase] ligase [Firmicutes bacterium]|nr:biotin--[acetyl-CoA-carboxylase] ligase [Bacillota bacterium]
MLHLGTLVDLLAAAPYVSGEDLAEQLGVTRTAVWKQVGILRKLGYQITAHPRRGYHLVGRPDKLYPWEVRKDLATQRIGKTIEYYDELPSTNRRAKEIVGTVPEGTVVLAETQLNGRGRLGRSWFSPPGTGIWLSLILHPSFSPVELPKLNLLAAAALSRAVHTTLGFRPLVKWPNDLYYQDRKLSGILTEAGGELGRLEYVILGVGINVNQKNSDFPAELRTKAGSLRMMSGRLVDRRQLFCGFLQIFEEEYFYALAQGFERSLAYCREYTATLGRPVEVDNGQRVYRGKAVAIAEDGALIIEAGGERSRVVAGDVQPLTDHCSCWKEESDELATKTEAD